MINKAETDEKKYLEEVQDKLCEALGGFYDKAKSRTREIRKHKNFLWENKRDMDYAEKVSVR